MLSIQLSGIIQDWREIAVSMLEMQLLGGGEMIGIVVDGKLIARAENVEQQTIYILNYNGMVNEDIAYLLSIPLESVTAFTEGGATR
ncbi:MAG: hypothetical protein IMF19_14270 [Proteobacteria bacterium]|nr:hypothetical protein [Pseudomonadota bacterium]